MLQQYGPGADSLALEDLGLLGSPDDVWGVAVIEGGAEMDEFVKAALFSLLATVLYYDAVVRRRESMWRDGRKYGVFLHLLAQTVSKIPQGIFFSCANLFAFQTKMTRSRFLHEIEPVLI
jgi:hypothetical protein